MGHNSKTGHTQYFKLTLDSRATEFVLLIILQRTPRKELLRRVNCTDCVKQKLGRFVCHK